jgi:hypothetical protein
MAACIASILNLSLDVVPNFRELAGDGCNTKYLNPWLAQRGMSYISMPLWENIPFYWNSVWCLCDVPSQMFEGGSHYVVGLFHKADRGCQELSIVHDPNPHNTRIYTVEDVTRVGFLIWTGTHPL